MFKYTFYLPIMNAVWYMPVTQAAVITEDIVNNSKVGEKADDKAEKKVTIGANINTVLRPYL